MIRFLLIFIQFIIGSNFAFAGLTPTQLGLKHPELAYVYQQPRFLEEDILGDLLLASSAKTAAKGLFYILAGNRGEFYSKRYIEAYRLGALYPHMSRTNFDVPVYLKTLPQPDNYYILDVENMNDAFSKMTREQKVHVGTFPNWSKSFKKNYQNTYLSKIYPSKLLLCLVRGVCARFMLTGHEKELEEWSLKRKDQSLSPEILFKKALDFSKGNISQALLTCNNLLSWYSKSPNRHMTPLQAKLRPFKTVHGDLSKDKFGEWYHLFGLITYSFAKGDEKAGLIGTTESLGGRIITKFQSEIVEETANNVASQIGDHLRELLSELSTTQK